MTSANFSGTGYRYRKPFFRLPRPKRAGIANAYAHYRRLGLSRIAALRGAIAITLTAMM
jgi:hypothetical protein